MISSGKPRVLVALTAALLAAGCDSGPPAGPTRSATPGAPSVAPLVSDCAAIAAMVPPGVSPGMGVDNSLGTLTPTGSEYLAYCNMIGPYAGEARLRIGLQATMIRPRVDPYESKSLADWLRAKPRELATVGACTRPEPWTAVPNGFRCVADNALSAIRFEVVTGADRGTVIQIQVQAFQVDPSDPVPLEIAAAASDLAAEKTIRALFESI